jgi:hypothetical protein
MNLAPLRNFFKRDLIVLAGIRFFADLLEIAQEGHPCPIFRFFQRGVHFVPQVKHLHFKEEIEFV